MLSTACLSYNNQLSPVMLAHAQQYKQKNGSILTDTPTHLQIDLKVINLKNLPNSYFIYKRICSCVNADDNNTAVDIINSASVIAFGRYLLKECAACRPDAH